MRTYIFAVTLALVLGASLAPAADASSSQAAFHSDEDEATLLAVRMYADWCGYCEALDNKLDQEVRPGLTDASIVFICFDMTDEDTQRHTRMYASYLGLEEVFDRHQGQTGYMVLVDPESGEELDRITSDVSPSAMHETLVRAASN